MSDYIQQLQFKKIIRKKNIEKSHLYFCKCFFVLRKNKNKHNEQIKENYTIFS